MEADPSTLARQPVVMHDRGGRSPVLLESIGRKSLDGSGSVQGSSDLGREASSIIEYRQRSVFNSDEEFTLAKRVGSSS